MWRVNGGSVQISARSLTGKRVALFVWDLILSKRTLWNVSCKWFDVPDGGSLPITKVIHLYSLTSGLALASSRLCPKGPIIKLTLQSAHMIDAI